MKCILCGGEKRKVLYKIGKDRIYECRACGFIFAHSQTRLTHGYYEKVYWGNPDRAFYDYYYGRKLKGLHSFYLGKIEKYLGRKGKILDVGAGLGYFVREARKEGWMAEGIEPSEAASYFAKKSLSLNLIQTDWEDYFPKKKFEAAAIIHTLEHVSHPVRFLKKLSGFLTRSGIILIEVPNVKAPLAKIRGKGNFDPQSHKYYFSLSTLSRILEVAGYKVLEARTLQNQRTTLLFSIIKIKKSLRRKLEEKNQVSGKLNTIFILVGIVDNFLWPIKKLMEFFDWGEQLFVVAGKS